jgi:hypothetical protein
MSGSSKFIVKMSTIAVTLLAALVAFYAFFLLVIGQPWTIAYEGGENQGLRFISAPAAVIPFLAAILLLLGVLTGKKLWAWLGLTILLAFSILFLFGIGGILLPVAGFLFILLIAIQLSPRIIR